MTHTYTNKHTNVLVILGSQVRAWFEKNWQIQLLFQLHETVTSEEVIHSSFPQI